MNRPVTGPLFFQLHLICSLYVFGTEILFSDSLSILILILFLLYLILIVLPMAFRDGRITLFLYLCSTILLIISADYIPAAFYLLPLHISRILLIVSLQPVLEGAAYLLPLFLKGRWSLLLYLLFSVILYLVLFVLRRIERTAKDREGKIDNLERENRVLAERLNRTVEAEREREYLAKLEERGRISVKIHDEIGHTITGGIVQLQAAAAIMADDPPRAERMIGNVTEALKQGMDLIRRDLKSLKPGNEELGVQHIRNLLADFENRTAIPTHLETTGRLSVIPLEQWITFRLNLKEALTNILKHSRAQEVHVSVKALNKLIRMEIRDNGIGTMQVVPGMGLSGMESRTREAGGTLILDGSKGFSVIMIFKKEDLHGGDQDSNRR